MNQPKTLVSEVGLPAALECMAEECCELGQAALKLSRKIRNENPTPKTYEDCVAHLAEELSDVCLNIDLILQHDALLGDESMHLNSAKEYYYREKLARFEKRLAEKKKEDNNGNHSM